MTVAIDIPVGPSVNDMYGRTSSGRLYLKPKTRAWQLEAGWLIHAKRRRITPIRGPYTLHLILSSKGRRGDASNRIKAVEDLLVKHGITPDDRLCENPQASWDQTGTIEKGWCRVIVAPVRQTKEAA